MGNLNVIATLSNLIKPQPEKGKEWLMNSSLALMIINSSYISHKAYHIKINLLNFMDQFQKVLGDTSNEKLSEWAKQLVHLIL